MLDKSLRVAFIAGQPVTPAERHEILMTIQLPDNFFVTGNLSIKVVQTAPMHERRAFARHRFKLPVNWLAEIQITKTQQIKSPRNKAIGFLNNPFFDPRPSPFELKNGRLSIGER